MYYIETRVNGEWRSDGVGDANEFVTDVEAMRAIVELITMTVRDPFGHNYSTDPADYRVCERQVHPVLAHSGSTTALTECAYCARDVPAGDDAEPPNVADDDAWVELAMHHAEDCEWITTRAHRQEV